MNGRERIEAAFSSQGSPEFGAVICYEGIYYRDHWVARDPRQRITSYPWWYAQSPDLEHQKAWLSEAIPSTGQDWMELHGCMPRNYREQRQVVVEPNGVFLLDRLSGEKIELHPPVVSGWEVQEGVDAYTDHRDRLADTSQEIDRLYPPAPPFDPEHYRREGRHELAAWQLDTLGQSLFPIRHVSSPLQDCFNLWGYEGMMLMVAERPDLVHYACQRYLEYSLDAVQEAHLLGAGGIWIEECFTDQISPAAYQELNLPYLRPLVEAIHSKQMHSILYFCGNPKVKLELLVQSGAQALSLEESKKGFTIDIDTLSDFLQGRVVLLGNLDAIHLLPQVNEAELRSEIRRQVAAGRRNGSRFIMSLGSPVTPGTPPQRVRLYCDLTHEMGRR
jgi:hypothetical protein